MCVYAPPTHVIQVYYYYQVDFGRWRLLQYKHTNRILPSYKCYFLSNRFFNVCLNPEDGVLEESPFNSDVNHYASVMARKVVY